MSACPRCQSLNTAFLPDVELPWTSLLLRIPGWRGPRPALPRGYRPPPARHSIRGRILLLCLFGFTFSYQLNSILQRSLPHLPLVTPSTVHAGTLPPDYSSGLVDANRLPAPEPLPLVRQINPLLSFLLLSMQLGMLSFLVWSIRVTRCYNCTIWAPAYRRWRATSLCLACGKLAEPSALLQLCSQSFHRPCAAVPKGNHCLTH